MCWLEPSSNSEVSDLKKATRVKRRKFSVEKYKINDLKVKAARLGITFNPTTKALKKKLIFLIMEVRIKS